MLCQATGAPQECQGSCEPPVNVETETLLAPNYSGSGSGGGGGGRTGCANRLLFGVRAPLGFSRTCSEHMDSRVTPGGPDLQLQQIAIYFTWPLETSFPQVEIYNILYLRSGLLYPAGMLTAKALIEC